MSLWESPLSEVPLYSVVQFAFVGILLGLPIEFVMTNYSAHKKLTTVPWYSPPFLSQYQGGYKSIRVDANGWGDGAGTHVSVYVFFMEVNNHVPVDRTSFCYDVTIQLVNHSNEQDQYDIARHTVI